MTSPQPLILASGSPRRRQLLEMLGLEHRVVPPDVDETRHDGEAPGDYVVRLAREKARAVSRREPKALVLAADTTVVLESELFAKPESVADAVAMLGRLAGRTHQVYTGVALARGERVETALDVSDVTFRRLSPELISQYVATGEPMDKAGAYAIQGQGAALIDGIRGDFFGVMGLPLKLVLDLLERFGRPYRFTR
ncbi:MAG TPA: Maf family protein [Gemmatimonadales bacterium]|nr:Maf family protein [Gemmatimonadales bacterium]